MRPAFLMKGDTMYRDLKEKFRQKKNDVMYENLFYNMLCEMFVYDERIFRPELIDILLHMMGQCALIKTSTSDFTPVLLNFAGGERYADGTFSTAICFDFIGTEYRFSDWMHNPDICVLFNNHTRSYTEWVEKYAYMLTEIDTSINNNVFFSRMKRIPVASDSQTKTKIDQAIDDISTGKIKTIIREQGIQDLIDGKSSGIEMLDLTDVTKSQYLQYLAHLYDCILSRVYELSGVGYSDGAKQVQISVDELTRNDMASLIHPNVWYETRKRGFTEYAKKSGIELEFDFSDIWRTRNNEYLTGGDDNETGEQGENPETEPDSNAEEQTSESTS